MNLSQKQRVFTLNCSKLIEYINSQGYSCTFGETYRTPEQAQIYAQKGLGIKDSLHCKRLAVDLNLFDSNGNYLTSVKDHEKFGMYWESLDPLNRWGGRFTNADGNHYERQDK